MNGLAAADIDHDGIREFVLSGAERGGLDPFTSPSSGLLRIGSPSFPVVWEYQRPFGISDTLGSLALADLDGDETDEIVLGGSSAIQINSVQAVSVDVHVVQLPMLARGN